MPKRMKPVGRPLAKPDTGTSQKGASDSPKPATSQSKRGWGGKRSGAGRPSKARQKQRARDAAEATLAKLQAPLDLKGSLTELINAQRLSLAAEIAKGPNASKKHISECSQGIRGATDLYLQIEQTEQSVPMQPAKIVAPAIEPDSETWRRKYAPLSREENRRPLADAAEPKPLPPADTNPTSSPSPADDFEPPARQEPLQPGPYLTGLGPHEFGELGPEQLADLQRGRRKGTP